MRKQFFIPAMLILAAGLLQGCNQQDTAAKAQTDAAKAQAWDAALGAFRAGTTLTVR